MTLRFYFDECISFRLAEALKALENESDIEIRHFMDEFPDGHPRGEGDVPWIDALAERGQTLVRPHAR